MYITSSLTVSYVHSHEKRYMCGAISLMSNMWIYVQQYIHPQIEDLENQKLFLIFTQCNLIGFLEKPCFNYHWKPYKLSIALYSFI